MVDVTREFARQPPQEPLVTLAAVVRDFKWRYPRTRRDMVVEYCRDAADIEQAIWRAVHSKGADGKHHNHQSKIRRDAYAPFCEQLWEVAAELAECPSFIQLLMAVHGCAVEVGGWGPVGVYDVSTRIAAFVEVPVDAVYLHAGVEAGAVALFGADWVRARAVDSGVFRRLLLDDLKSCALASLDADSIEDLLCTYRSWFETERFAELGLAWDDVGVASVGDLAAHRAARGRRPVRRRPKRQ